MTNFPTLQDKVYFTGKILCLSLMPTSNEKLSLKITLWCAVSQRQLLSVPKVFLLGFLYFPIFIKPTSVFMLTSLITILNSV